MRWRKEERDNIDRICCKLCILPVIKRVCYYFTVVCFLCEVCCSGFFSKDERDTVVDLEQGKSLECVQDSQHEICNKNRWLLSRTYRVLSSCMCSRTPLQCSFPMVSSGLNIFVPQGLLLGTVLHHQAIKHKVAMFSELSFVWASSAKMRGILFC